MKLNYILFHLKSYANSQYSSDSNKKASGNRFPIELFQKNESNLNSSHMNNATSINQQTNLLNSFRIRSAQNAAKQRATGKKATHLNSDSILL